MELQVRPMAAVAAHKVLVVLEELRAGGLLSLELPERSFRAETATMKVVVVVVAGLAVVVVRTRQVPRYLGVGVVVAVRVMLHSSRMVRRPLGAALHRVGRSTRWQRRAVCRRDQRSAVVAEATKTSPTASRNLRQAHRQSPTTSITSQPRDLRRIPRVGRPLAQHKPDHRSRGTCEPSALRLVRPTSSTCER